ncbi:hypothetical protein GCM10010211_70920 [Streptomyces albospinus]|uniref:Transposase n=1 Tax=Streptomyces albospinus TaxID=285515 RepID=A0ABQ2VMI0_9ACTN|nr:hypothetical protein [Streptomyces albospinus]GGU93862.1 hypothetical protein GCM10010211_70920 [Streptomyces albospinus]
MGQLVSEMITLHTHARHLEWPSEHENCPDASRLLTLSIVWQVMAGWHRRTDGGGTIDDLLSDDTRTSRVPAQHDRPSDSEPLSSKPHPLTQLGHG